MKFALIFLVLLTASIVGCTNKFNTSQFFDAALHGSLPYELPGVSGYDVRAYEIVQTSGDLVSVKITFASKAGPDVVETKKFRVDSDGRLHATDRKDIDDHIQKTLEEICLYAGTTAVKLHRSLGYDLSWDDVVKDYGTNFAWQFGPRKSVNSEDYSKVKFTIGMRSRVSASILDGDAHLIEYKSN